MEEMGEEVTMKQFFEFMVAADKRRERANAALMEKLDSARRMCNRIGNANAECRLAMGGTGSSSTTSACFDIGNNASSPDISNGVGEVLAPSCCSTDTSLVIASEVEVLAAPTPAKCSMKGPGRDSDELMPASTPATVPTTSTAIVDTSNVLDVAAPSGGTLDGEAASEVASTSATCSMVCLPRHPVAAPVFVAPSPTTPIEYALNTNHVHVAAVPLATTGEFAAVLAPTAYTPTVPMQKLYDASELFRPSSSQFITNTIPVQRPMPWPSFMGIHVDGDQTWPLPWPSLIEIDCCEFSSEAAEKASQWCSSESSLAKSCAALEFQILESYGNLCKSTGCIIVHEMCIFGELR